jgi:glycosyltransferase involved in cell wall biosynthesis
MRLSFCITYCNEGPLLNELVEAALAQAEGPDEILVYDDCSDTPPSGLPLSDKVRVIRGAERLGPAKGRNALLAAATGDAIHFHDADDLVLPGWAAAVRRGLANGEDCVFVEFEARRGAEVMPWSMGLAGLGKDEDLLGLCLRSPMLPAIGAYRAAFLRGIGGYPDYWQSEDYAFHLRVALARPTYSVATEPLVVIRLRADGRSADKPRVYLDGLQALRDLRGRLPASHHAIAGRKALSLARSLFRLGDRAGARAGFALARAFCPDPYAEQPRAYRWAAATVGPARAEQVSLALQALKAIGRDRVAPSR